MTVSVIIPIYNTPEYAFRRCMDSIMKQTFRDFEVLLIDDGSEEANSETYRAYEGTDDRIRYEKIANQGVSHARNRGIEKAGGEYLCFVDADDTVSERFLESAVEKARVYGADLVIGRIRKIPEAEDRYQKINTLTVIRDPGQMALSMFAYDLDSEVRVMGSPCGRLYRTAIAQQIRFDETLCYSEDQVFNRAFIGRAQTFAAVPEDWYDYYQNEYSATHRHKKWDEQEKWTVFWRKWAEMNRGETDPRVRLELDKNLICYFHIAVHEGILAGERYSRKKLLDLMSDEAFRPCREIRVRDCRSILFRAVLLMMKRKWTGLLYIAEKLYARTQRDAERTN